MTSLLRELPAVLSLYFDNPKKYVLVKTFKRTVVLIRKDGSKYVVKQYSASSDAERLNFFEELQNFTNDELGIAPKVLRTIDGKLNARVKGCHYEIAEFLDSEEFDNSSVREVKKFYYDIGFFVGQMHRVFRKFEKKNKRKVISLLHFTPDCLGDMRALMDDYIKYDIEKKWVDVLKAKIGIIEKYSNLVKSLEGLPRGIVHGDFYIKNVLFGDNLKIIGLIDFAQAGWFFRCYEVMRSLIQTNRYLKYFDLDPINLTSFIAGYSKNSKLTETETNLMLDLYIFIQATDRSFIDIRTIKSNDDGLHEYAMYRYKSLMSLHNNREVLINSIHGRT